MGWGGKRGRLQKSLATLAGYLSREKLRVHQHCFSSALSSSVEELESSVSSLEDTSTIWGLTIDSVPQPDAIPLLLVQVVGAEDGPTGGDELSEATFVQRLNTVGGVAPPSTSCAASGDVGTMALVPYSADYFFYKAIKRISSR